MDAVEEHNRLFREAFSLLEGKLRIGGKPEPTFSVQSEADTREAIELLEQVVTLNPGNWAAFWAMGKAHQALDQHDAALRCFSSGLALNSKDAGIAQEAAIEAMECCRPDLAVTYGRVAVGLAPNNPGVQANLGLAFLFSGNPDHAQEVLRAALEANPSDLITQGLIKIVAEVQTGERPCPHNAGDLELDRGPQA
jgi:tetratricopeptide (TPR) repeat protein